MNKFLPTYKSLTVVVIPVNVERPLTFNEFKVAPPLASINPVNVETPVTFRFSNAPSLIVAPPMVAIPVTFNEFKVAPPVTSKPPLASINPVNVDIPLTTTLLRSNPPDRVDIPDTSSEVTDAIPPITFLEVTESEFCEILKKNISNTKKKILRHKIVKSSKIEDLAKNSIIRKKR